MGEGEAPGLEGRPGVRIEKGLKVGYLGRVPGLEFRSMHDAVVLDTEGRFVKLQARPAWGKKKYEFWVEKSYLKERLAFEYR